jgi:hypothetical protein
MRPGQTRHRASTGGRVLLAVVLVGAAVSCLHDPDETVESAGGAAGQGGAAGGTIAGAAGQGGKGGQGGTGGPGKAGAGELAGAGSSGKAQGGAAGAGVAGTGGSSGGGQELPAVANLGARCGSDSDCGDGGKCLQATGSDLFDGGPAGGFCTIDCSQYLKDSKGKAPPDLPKQYPCDPTVNPNEPGVQISAICLDFAASAGDPPQGYCTPLCAFGQPAGETALNPAKCGGRDDVVCYPLARADGTLEQAFCRPYCQTSQGSGQCPDGSVCDQSSGVCVKSKPPDLKANGRGCTITTDPGAPQECAGLCVRLHDPAKSPPAKAASGICVDPCEVGSPAACGGLTEGYCGFNLFAPNQDGTVAGQRDPIPAAPGDLGACLVTTTPGDDSRCYWQEGWLSHAYGPIALCLTAQECVDDAGCALACQLADDCPSGDLCKGGKCLDKEGKLDTFHNRCLRVDKLCGKSFCLDHEVDESTLGGAGAPCGGGAGGAGGKGGAAGGSAAGKAGVAGKGGA